MSNQSTVDAEKATATGMKQVSESNKSHFRQYSTRDAFCMVYVAELHLCCREVFSKANGQSLLVSLIGRPAPHRERYTSAAAEIDWVAGASRGIGQAIAEAMAAEGANLILLAQRKGALEEVWIATAILDTVI